MIACTSTTRRPAWHGTVIALAMATLGLGAAPAVAQDWPAKAVRIVVPFAPGGSADVYGRAIAEKLQAAIDRARNAPAASPAGQPPQAAPGGQAAPPRRRNPLGDLLNELGR